MKQDIQTIEHIFREVKKIIPSGCDGAHEWLISLKEDAVNSNSTLAWLNTLKGFLRGLWAANIIELADIDDIDKILIKTKLLN